MTRCKAWQYVNSQAWHMDDCDPVCPPHPGRGIKVCGQPAGHPGNHVALIGNAADRIPLKLEDKVEILSRVFRYREAMVDTWIPATVVNTDVYKSYGTVFLVLIDGTDNEYASLKYADEDKQWRRVVDEIARLRRDHDLLKGIVKQMVDTGAIDPDVFGDLRRILGIMKT